MQRRFMVSTVDNFLWQWQRKRVLRGVLKTKTILKNIMYTDYETQNSYLCAQPKLYASG